MDKKTSDKLNATLSKMGAIDNGAKVTANANKGSSDMSFYVVMLAIIVAMGFYISNDTEQRYGSSGIKTMGDTITAAQTENSHPQPIVLGVETVNSVNIKPVAEVPAGENTPAAIVIETTEQETVVTTTVVPVQQTAEEETAESASIAPVDNTAVVEPTPAVEAVVVEVAPAPIAVTEPIVQATQAEPVAAEPEARPMLESMLQTVEVITAPVVEKVNTVVQSIQPQAPATQTVQAPVSVAQPTAPMSNNSAANPYANPYYGRPYPGYQQPQQQYGNPYNQQPQQQYGNPYGNPYNQQPYNNPYANPYGNPYQQPAN